MTAGGALSGADLPSDDLPDVAPILHADDLLLRPWRYDDADQVVLLAADPDSRRWSPSLRTVDDKAGAEAWIANQRSVGSSFFQPNCTDVSRPPIATRTPEWCDAAAVGSTIWPKRRLV